MKNFSQKEIIIAAGGTGGHLFPAQQLAVNLFENGFKEKLLFMSGGLSTNVCFDRNRFDFVDLSCSRISFKSPYQFLRGSWSLIKGVFEAVATIKKIKPRLIVGFGSYHTLAVMAAGKYLKIPYILYESNAVLGRTQRLFAKGAKAAAINFPLLNDFRDNQILVRSLVKRSQKSKQELRKEAYDYFQLSPSKPVLLVCGGSQGASFINGLTQSMVKLIGLKKISFPYQVIHLTGKSVDPDAFSALYRENGVTARVKSFESEMELAWSIASLFIGRGGAGTMNEAIEYAVPGVIIPYHLAADKHQEKNADFFVSIGGGARLLENEATAECVLEKLDHLLNVYLAGCIKRLEEYRNEQNERVSLAELVISHLN